MLICAVDIFVRGTRLQKTEFPRRSESALSNWLSFQRHLNSINEQFCWTLLESIGISTSISSTDGYVVSKSFNKFIAILLSISLKFWYSRSYCNFVINFSEFLSNLVNFNLNKLLYLLPNWLESLVYRNCQRFKFNKSLEFF